MRFTPSGGLPVASEYKVELDPAKVVTGTQVFSGETELTVKTDKFLVEEVTVLEEPALEGKGKVVFRGELRFNYAVDPKHAGTSRQGGRSGQAGGDGGHAGDGVQQPGRGLPHGAGAEAGRRSGRSS